MNRKGVIVPFLFLFALLCAAPEVGAGRRSPEAAGQVRGVWLHPGLFGPARDVAAAKIPAVLDAYVKAGINSLFILVKNTTGHVYFQSRIGVADPAYGWDFFDLFLAEARKRNMTVHAWFCVFPEAAVLGEVRQHPEWLIRDKERRFVATANPALPAVRQYEISLMLELVRRYPVDWVHLDYIRYPCDPVEPNFSFDGETLRLFKEFSGVDLLQVKAHDSGNMFWNAWLEWNRGQVTQFMRELGEALRLVGRRVQVSAAVFPDPVNASVLIGQDWPRWAEEGLVEMLCPMLYTNHTAFFEKAVRRAMEAAKGRSLLCPGIGIGTSHNQNTPEGMAEQMRISRKLGAAGVVFFSGSSLGEPFLERLKGLDGARPLASGDPASQRR
jgi:uncharacterized lipoprotein YddW (UPF0748 family)